MIVLFILNIIVLILSIVLDIFFIKEKHNSLPQYKKISNISFWVANILTFFIYVIYIANLLFNNFEYAYVYTNSELSQSIIYKIVGAHSGSNGAFLLWLVISCIVGIILRRYLSKYNNLIIINNISTNHINEYLFRGIFSILPLFLLILFFIGNPFELTINKYPELINTSECIKNINCININNGLGLNPILCSPYNIVHPFFIFFSYTLLFVPFVAVIVGLIEKDYKKWISIAENFNNYALASLAIALLLGSIWAYNSFGWGGIWNWDIIENVALITFIFSIVFNHFVLVNKKTDGLVRSLHLIALLTFPIVLFSTFIARSDILKNASLHIYDANQTNLISIILTIILIILGIIIVFIFIKNLKKINKTCNYVVFNFLSKEMFISLGSLVLIALSIVLLIGIFHPIIVSALNLIVKPITNEFYIRWATIIGIIYFVILAISILIGWGKNTFTDFSNKILVSFVLSTILMLLIFFYGINRIDVLLLSFVCLFTCFASVHKIIINRKKIKLYLTSSLSHIGISMFILFAVISAFETKSNTYKVELGKEIEIYNYKLKFNEILENKVNNRLEQNFILNLYDNKANSVNFDAKLIYKSKKQPLKFTDIKRQDIIDIHITPLILMVDTKIPYNILKIGQERKTKILNNIKIALIKIDEKNNTVVSINNNNILDTLNLKAPLKENEFFWEKIVGTKYECAIGNVFDINNEKLVSLIYRFENQKLPVPIKVLKLEFITKPYIIFVWISSFIFIVGLILNIRLKFN